MHITIIVKKLIKKRKGIEKENKTKEKHNSTDRD
jgi:hypothetical protein